MLRNTFCHIPLISVKTESKLWLAGVHSWENSCRIDRSLLSARKADNVQKYIGESIEELSKQNPLYFSRLLPPNQHWRLFPEFRHTLAFVDIETTGLGGPGDYITTIALYDGQSVSYYVNGRNLEEFESVIRRYKLLVSYNGKCFDIPFIENYFGIRLNAAHIDLRYVLRSLGYSGGLKRCEQRLGISRAELDGVDGYFAVLLWNDYKRRKNVHALESLLAYNIQDVVNLELLMVKAYNMKLEETPFAETHHLSSVGSPDLPFEAHTPTIARIRREVFGI